MCRQTKAVGKGRNKSGKGERSFVGEGQLKESNKNHPHKWQWNASPESIHKGRGRLQLDDVARCLSSAFRSGGMMLRSGSVVKGSNAARSSGVC
ncbi:Hypothetical protein ZHAS_00022148 [Anopheles sinensis]|uniref:Uncharacterized protein n=1 Tax=Anopheles sinensis TaxID=74873 RepID=A0A084WU72_ANOSI|nr:Hypothetical protein ZHAS_00022148 [Anopheles sinensis]